MAIVEARRRGNPDGTPAWGGVEPPLLDGVGAFRPDNTIDLREWISKIRKLETGAIVAGFAAGERTILWGDAAKSLEEQLPLALKTWASKGDLQIVEAPGEWRVNADGVLELQAEAPPAPAEPAPASDEPATRRRR